MYPVSLYKVIIGSLLVFAGNLLNAQNIIYNFTGTGDWNNPANWNNNTIPPIVLPNSSQININPLPGGQCILSAQEVIAPGGSLIVQQNANFLITGNLDIQPGTTSLPNTIDKTDTLKVMAYNVLNYGDGCQGSLSTLNSYLKTIIQYTQPDLLSCEKMTAFAATATGAANYAAVITDSVLNILFPNRFAFATPTNVAGDTVTWDDT